MLRTVRNSDLDWIADACLVSARTRKWELGGRTPTPDLLRHLVWERVLVQGVVEEGGRPMALLQVHDSDLQNGHAKVGILVTPEATDSGKHAIRAALDGLLRDACRDFPFRKFYLEVDGRRSEEVEALSPVTLVLEGSLIAHERVDRTNYSDLLIYSVYPGELPATRDPTHDQFNGIADPP